MDLWDDVHVVLGLAFLLVHCATGTFQDLNCDWDDLLDDQRHNLGKNVWVQSKGVYNHMDGVCVLDQIDSN